MPEEPKEEDVDLKGLCEKSMDGQHKWEVKEGGMICTHCQLFTTKKLLFD